MDQTKLTAPTNLTKSESVSDPSPKIVVYVNKYYDGRTILESPGCG